MKIINEQKIVNILNKSKPPTKKAVKAVLEKAKKKKGLKLEEAAVLINNQDKSLLKEMFETARRVKLELYGPRLVLFAPLYVSSYCVNDCEYCAFHRRNKSPRKKLSLNEVRKQVEILEEMGHKRLLLEFGEDAKNNPINYVTDVIKTIYSVKKGEGSIRRVNVNIAATTVENYKLLKQAGIGTYQLFQETYHQPTYLKLHHGPKADYVRQITAIDRALTAGIDDVGIGVLFGLYDWRFEVLALLSHAQYLENKYGVGPHTISVPRFNPATTVKLKTKYQVSDNDFLKLIAILRLAVPYTGMIMSTRETPRLRRQAFQIGISQTSAASNTAPGGYGQKNILEQFTLYDHRSLDEVVNDICRLGYLPSFCTACYRRGRTGDKFMQLAKSGKIQDFCGPNALLTFKEFLLDYASKKTRKIGDKIIHQQVGKIKSKAKQADLRVKIKEIANKKRDIYL